MTQVGIQRDPERYSQLDQFLISQHQPVVRVFLEKHFPWGQTVTMWQQELQQKQDWVICRIDSEIIVRGFLCLQVKEVC